MRLASGDGRRLASRVAHPSNERPDTLPALNPLWRRLNAAPHRLLFLAGAAQTVLAMLWWAGALEAKLRGTAMASPLPDAAMHAWLMLYGLFPFFVFGFLFTALPNWVESGKVSSRAFQGTAGLFISGALLVYAGFVLPLLAGLGLAAHLAGWAIGLNALLGILRDSKHADKRQPWLAWGATLMGGVGELAFLAALAGGDPGWAATGATLAVWAFLTPLFLAVCHRMLPFFTSRIVANYVVVRPHGPLWAMVAASLGHGALEILGLDPWTWLVDLPLAGLALWFVGHWGIARALHERLLAMLHIGFVWAAAAFLLHALDSLLALAGPGWRLGLAPSHALGIGFFASMLLAMASRVTLGHSGRPLKADGLTWGLFWLVQLTALTRMAPDLFPSLIPYRTVLLAAWLWLAVFAAWGWRYAPMLWRARADGKAG